MSSPNNLARSLNGLLLGLGETGSLIPAASLAVSGLNRI
jgi:hypothetical protein